MRVYSSAVEAMWEEALAERIALHWQDSLATTTTAMYTPFVFYSIHVLLHLTNLFSSNSKHNL